MTGLYHIWDNETGDWYYGNYGGLKDIGKIYKTEAGAKQAMSGMYGAKFAEPYPGGTDRVTQDAWRDRHWANHRANRAAWNENKHKSFKELFGPRFELRVL